ncbi:MAG TPA: site-specific integrase [Gaiellaceae bacterium]|nr:site-specific integrase [Gaiellaceae bacterium]
MARHRRPRREWGTGSIFPTAKGYWRVSIPLPSDPFGHRRRKEWQFREEAAARRWLDKVQRRLDRGLEPEESRVTVAEYAPEWLASLQVKDSTKAMYGSLVRNQLGWLGDVRLTRLMPQDIRALLAEREREGYSGRTRRGILDVLRMMLRMAEGDGIVEKNVAELVDPPAVNAKEPIHFTAEQARKFLEAAKDDNLYSLYAVALATGLRRGELLALTWRDCDLDGTGTIIVRSGKTAAAARRVPLAAFAVVALRSSRRHPGRIWPYDPSYVTRHVKVICRRAGVPQLTFHQLRSSAASILLAEGVSMDVIRQILGHTRVSMTAHYARVEDEMKREAVERLGKAVAG